VLGEPGLVGRREHLGEADARSRRRCGGLSGVAAEDAPEDRALGVEVHHDVVVVWLDQRQLDLLAPLPRLLVHGEIGARVSLGVGRPIREALKERVAERLELCGHIRFAPRTQQDNVIRQRWDPKRSHAHNLGPETSWTRACRSASADVALQRQGVALPPSTGGCRGQVV